MHNILCGSIPRSACGCAAPLRRFSVKLNSATGFVMPTKPKKTWMKHFDDVSVQKRCVELEAYLQELIKIPAIGSNPDVLRFLNVPISETVDTMDSSARLQRIEALVVQSSTADTEAAPPLTVAGLTRLAKVSDESMSKHLCNAIERRLHKEHPLCKCDCCVNTYGLLHSL